MAYIEVEVDIEDHLDEVADDDLIKELKRRKRDIIDRKDACLDGDLETALWHAQGGRHSEALIYLEHALPQFKGLLWKVTP